LLVTSVLLAAAAPAEGEPHVSATPGSEDALPALEADAQTLGDRWAREQAGFDALESYRLDLEGLGIAVVFGVARRWRDRDHVDLLVFIREPVQMDEVAYLWKRSPAEGDGIFTYYTPQLVNFAGSVAELRARQVARFPLPRLSSGTVESMSLASFLPYLPGELRFRLLGEGGVDGEPVLRLEAVPSDGRDLGFTRLELWLSGRTGVALRSIYYDGEIEMRRVETRAADVRQQDGRWVAARLAIRTADGAMATLALEERRGDPRFDPRIFTRENLRYGRFPEF
jgi:hypothetical protein